MNGFRDETINSLREISNKLDSDPLARFKTVLFPGWDIKTDGEQGFLIRQAATAILAPDVSLDEGIEVSQKSIAALLHYIADMME